MPKGNHSTFVSRLFQINEERTFTYDREDISVMIVFTTGATLTGFMDGVTNDMISLVPSNDSGDRLDAHPVTINLEHVMYVQQIPTSSDAGLNLH